MLVTCIVILTISIITINHIGFEFLNIFQGHFDQRTDIYNPEKSSLSLLAWLMGFDQILSSIDKNIFFGLGLGSTGEFNFDSKHKDILNVLGAGDLTLKDAYSLFFRLVIEID